MARQCNLCPGDQQAAVINGGLNFNGANNDEIQIGAANLGATSVTVSAWLRVKSFTETTFSAAAGNVRCGCFQHKERGHERFPDARGITGTWWSWSPERACVL